MLTGKQFKIFEVFAKKPFAEHTRNQVKNESKEKSNNALAITINSLKKEEVVIEKKIGKSGILTLNLNNDLTFFYIELCNNQLLENPVKLSIKILKNEIDKQTHFYSMVIFGSYAIGKQKRTSDLDIVVFIECEEKKKRIEAAINSAKLKTPLEVDVHVVSQGEMAEMLANDEENLGKQIARKHLAVHNLQIFYSIIKEGMKHGFRA